MGVTTPLVNGVAMLREAIGVYSYDYQTPLSVAGKYRWRCRATDGVKIAIKEDVFKLET